MTVQEGRSASFTVGARTGFEIANVSGCGGQLSGSSYTINEVTRDCEISATFEQLTFELVAELHFGESPGGSDVPSITPESSVVDYNEQQVFVLTLPDSQWSLQDIEGCPVDSIEAQNSFETELLITTDPIVEACILNLYIDAPASDLEVELTFNVFNGEAQVHGERKEAASFRYGETVTIDLMPYGERSLRDFNASGIGGSCSIERDGNSVSLVATNDCWLYALFMAPEDHDFADDHLMQGFRDALALQPEEFLTEERVASVDSLRLLHQGNRIHNLSGIQAASSLRDFSFETSSADLEALAALPLERLHIEYRGSANIEPLAGLPLTELSLLHLDAEPESYEALRQLSHLESLNLSYNRRLHRIDFVEAMSQLNTLILTQTGLLDIRPTLDSGLPHQGSYGYLSVNGCASLQQPVTRDVIDELRQYSVETSVSSSSNWSLCPSSDQYYEGNLSASLQDTKLTLSWDTNAEGDLDCALYFNLHAQQPRVMDILVESCGTAGSTTLDVQLDIQTLDLYLEDGLFPNPAHVASTLVDNSANDSSKLRLAAVDWGQVTFKSNPYLVPERSALLRAHMIADGNPEPPELEVQLRLNGESQSLSMTAPEAISTAPVYDALDSSYQVQMPAEWMQAGLEIVISMDDDVIYRATPSFADPLNLYITIVPMVVDGVEPTIPSDAVLRETVKTYWPFSDVIIERRDPFIVEREGESLGAHDLLYMLRDLHAQEGAQHHYHGFFNLDTLGTQDAAGVAFMPGVVGVTWDASWGVHGTFAHELGHNFSIGHIACGGPTSVEVNYPYPPEFIGSVGVDYDFGRTYGSEDYADIMSYCRPRFISDWVYEKAQDYLTMNPPKPFTASQDFDVMTLSQPVFSTYISGVIDQVKGETEILSHFELNRAAGRETFGPFTLIATDSQGQQIERRFAVEQTSESTSQSNGYFNVQVPTVNIRHIQIRYQGREILTTQF
ncbi:hypothetical protein CWE09_13805 [Aliidiomarina minuta]|uniref:Peptidase M60 domain-containing protein n=2 Tax=Aliidiomarina minuta TaxID=880057 RepID=A0A432W198_9GAMM|nr:hypothetical protein CWE09_13805 [Aliidiomarina minuta]